METQKISFMHCHIVMCVLLLERDHPGLESKRMDGSKARESQKVLRVERSSG